MIIAFERFWQVTTSYQRPECSRLAAALEYLYASLHGVILETLRADARPQEGARPVPGEPQGEESTENSEALRVLQTTLANPREQRLAYLLFHCGLRP